MRTVYVDLKKIDIREGTKRTWDYCAIARRLRKMGFLGVRVETKGIRIRRRPVRIARQDVGKVKRFIEHFDALPKLSVRPISFRIRVPI